MDKTFDQELIDIGIEGLANQKEIVDNEVNISVSFSRQIVGLKP